MMATPNTRHGNDTKKTEQSNLHQKARNVHIDSKTCDSINDWQVLIKEYAILIESIKRKDYYERQFFESTDKEPNYTQLALPASANASEKFRHQYNQWMEIHLRTVFGGFMSGFIPELNQMLKKCPCLVIDTSQIVQGRRMIEKEFNFEHMLTSITRVVQVSAEEPVINRVTEHLKSMIKMAQTSTQCCKPIDSQVPILQFSDIPVNDLLFLLNLFTPTDDFTIERDAIEKCLMEYVPVTHVQVGMMKTEPNYRCAHCAASFTTITYQCASCEQMFCNNCPLYSIKAPRIGINSPCPICQQCTTKLALKDVEDWTTKALNLIQSGAEGCLKSAMACVIIAIHTTKVLPVAHLRKVATGLLKMGFQEQALVILSVTKEVSSPEHCVKLYISAVKALQGISDKQGKSWREKWLLALAAQEATSLSDEISTVCVSHLPIISKEIKKSIADIKLKKRTEYNALVEFHVRKLCEAWERRDIPKMLNIITSTEVINEDALILQDGIEPAVKALVTFLGQKIEFIQQMLPKDHFAIIFFQGYSLICNSQVKGGLDIIENVVWSGYYNNWLSEAAVNLIISQQEWHPSVRKELVTLCKEIINNRPLPQICFSNLLNVLGISQEDLNPSLKSCWPELSVPGINQDATRKYENTVQQQVKKGKLNYLEAGFALINFIPSSSHPSEEMVCFLNASLWFLKDLKSMEMVDSQHIYALKKLILKCVEEACLVACVDLHPGMQFYASRFGLAIAAEAITAAGKFATSGDTNILVELFHSVIYKGRFSPFWRMPIVPVCEAFILDIFTGRLHTEFMLQLQRDQSNGLLKSEEIKYQLYENDLRWVCPVEDKDAARERAMEALLKEKGLTWSDVSETMCSVLSPRTPEGWLIQQQHFEGNLPFVTLKGLEGNRSDSSIKVTVIPAGGNKNGLFSSVDIHTVLQIPSEDIFPITFSLDPPSDSQRFHPFQEIKFKSMLLENTDVLHTLLQADYLMKCFAVGSDVSAKPPFKQRDCSEGLTANLPPNLKKVLTPVHKRGKSKNRRSRFWIEAEEIEYSCTQVGPVVNYRTGDVKMVIHSSPQRPGLDGEVHDIEEEDPDSPESKFAKDLTENYDEISKYFPIFGRLKELCKLQFLGMIIKEMKTNIPIPENIIHKIQQKTRRGNVMPRKTCTWVPAAVAFEEKGHSKQMYYGGVKLAPKCVESKTSVFTVRDEITGNFKQLAHFKGPQDASNATTYAPHLKGGGTAKVWEGNADVHGEWGGTMGQHNMDTGGGTAKVWEGNADVHGEWGGTMGQHNMDTGGGTAKVWEGNADVHGEWGGTMGQQNMDTGGGTAEVLEGNADGHGEGGGTMGQQNICSGVQLDDSKKIGGIHLAPKPKETTPQPTGEDEMIYVPSQTDNNPRTFLTPYGPFIAPKGLTVQKYTSNSTPHDFVRCSKPPINLDSTTMIVLEISLKEATKQAVSYLKGKERGRGGGGEGVVESEGGGRQSKSRDNGDNSSKELVTTALLLTSFLHHSHENIREKYEKCTRYQIKKASEGSQMKATDLLGSHPILLDPKQQEERMKVKFVDGMHVTHKVGLDLIKHILIKVDGKELTDNDVEIIQECYSKLENFELVSNHNYVFIENTLKNAIDECLENEKVLEATWKSLNGQPRVREVVTCLKKEYWPPAVSQRVQVLRQIYNPSNPAQNLWDM